jgi:hypothetical protein
MLWTEKNLFYFLLEEKVTILRASVSACLYRYMETVHEEMTIGRKGKDMRDFLVKDDHPIRTLSLTDEGIPIRQLEAELEYFNEADHVRAIAGVYEEEVHTGWKTNVLKTVLFVEGDEPLYPRACDLANRLGCKRVCFPPKPLEEYLK